MVIADIEPLHCEEGAERVRKCGRSGLPVPTDVMDTDQIHAMVEKADEEFGRIDILPPKRRSLMDTPTAPGGTATDVMST